jgi:hypothetical protein
VEYSYSHSSSSSSSGPPAGRRTVNCFAKASGCACGVADGEVPKSPGKPDPNAAITVCGSGGGIVVNAV